MATYNKSNSKTMGQKTFFTESIVFSILFLSFIIPSGNGSATGTFTKYPQDFSVKVYDVVRLNNAATVYIGSKLLTTGFTKVYIMARDDSDVLLWEKEAGCDAANSYGTKGISTSDGGLLVIAPSDCSNGASAACKYDSNGSFINCPYMTNVQGTAAWVGEVLGGSFIVIGNTANGGYSYKIDSSGNYISNNIYTTSHWLRGAVMDTNGFLRAIGDSNLKCILYKIDISTLTASYTEIAISGPTFDYLRCSSITNIGTSDFIISGTARWAPASVGFVARLSNTGSVTKSTLITGPFNWITTHIQLSDGTLLFSGFNSQNGGTPQLVTMKGDCCEYDPTYLTSVKLSDTNDNVGLTFAPSPNVAVASYRSTGPNGKMSITSVWVKLVCGPRYYIDDSTNLCTECKAGTYIDTVEQHSCLPCNEGYYQYSAHKSQCYECGSGSYSDTKNSTSCKMCPTGTYQPSQKSTSCFDCVPGTYCTSTDRTKYTECSPGYYQDLYKATACKKCGPGTFSNANKAIICQQCPEGQYQGISGKASCDDCPAGSYSNTKGQSSCTPCEPGKYQPYTGQTECLECLPGTHGDPTDKTKCNDCLPGYYQDQNSQAECKPCEPGTISDIGKAKECAKCPVGKHQVTSGKTTCDLCDYGTANALEGQIECAKCEPGFYQNSQGQTKCLMCLPGTFSAGYGNTLCTNCLDGQFQLESGKDKCNGIFLIIKLNKDCLYGCSKCTNTIRCIECKLSYLHKSGSDFDTCVTNCGPKYYQDGHECKKCDFRCLTCTGPSVENCVVCDISMLGVIRKEPFECTCDYGLIANITSGKCEFCDDPLCDICDPFDLTICKQCTNTIAGLTLDLSTFKCICQNGKYRNENKCDLCNPLCKECTGPTSKECLPSKCADKSYPLDNLLTKCLYMCVTAENNLYINPQTKTCKLCTAPCRSCFEEPTKCTGCINGFVLLGSQCLTNCPSKYYADDGVCMPCSEKCLECEKRTNYCIIGCKQPFLFKDHQCLENCGLGFTSINGTCVPCDSDCEACRMDSFTNQLTCLKCASPKLLHQGKCVVKCPNGMFPNENSECEFCNKACKECFGRTNHNCYECQTNLGYLMLGENYCDFLICTQGTYYNLTTLQCVNCPDVCTECENITKCTSCKPGFMLNKDSYKCYDPCNKLGFTRKQCSTDCTEICGDGRNFKFFECDDGNIKDNDGCNKDCKIEPNYECYGGDYSHSDICIFRKAPEIKRVQYFANRSAIITFSTIMQTDKKLEDILDFKIEGNLLGSEVIWTYNGFKPRAFNKLNFTLRYTYSLAGDEFLTLIFKNPGQMHDLNDNKFTQTNLKMKVYKYKYISEGELQSASSIGAASLYAMLPSLILSIILSFAFNTPIEGMWMAVSTLQLMSYMTLIDLNFPQNLLTFLEYVETVHNFNKWFPNPFVYLFPGSKLDMSAYNERFEGRGFANRNMLYLCGSDLSLMAFTMLFILILIPISTHISLAKTLLEKLRYSSITRSLFQAYLKLCLAGFVNIGIISFSNPAQAISSLITIIADCLLVGVPSIASEFLYRHRELANVNRTFIKRHSSYIIAFRVKINVLNLMFYPIFMFRRLAFAATITLLTNYPQIQLSFISLGSATFAFYLAYWKPFKSKYSLYSGLCAEIVFFVTALIMFSFTNNNGDATLSIIGWGIIGMTVLSLGVSWTCVALYQIQVYKLRKTYKEKKLKEEFEKRKMSIDESTLSYMKRSNALVQKTEPSRLRPKENMPEKFAKPVQKLTKK